MNLNTRQRSIALSLLALLFGSPLPCFADPMFSTSPAATAVARNAGNHQSVDHYRPRSYGVIQNGHWTIPKPKNASVQAILKWVDEADKTDPTVLIDNPELQAASLRKWRLPGPTPAQCVYQDIEDEKTRISAEACSALESRGSQISQTLVSYLLAPRRQLFDSYGSRAVCRCALQKFGASAVCALVNALRHSSNPMCSSDITETLYLIGQPTFDHLSKCIEAEDSTERQIGINTLLRVLTARDIYGQVVSYDFYGKQWVNHPRNIADDLSLHLSKAASQRIETRLNEAFGEFAEREAKLPYKPTFDDPELKRIGSNIALLISASGYSTSPSNQLVETLKHELLKPYERGVLVWSTAVPATDALARIAYNNLNSTQLNEVILTLKKARSNDLRGTVALRGLIVLDKDIQELRQCLSQGVQKIDLRTFELSVRTAADLDQVTAQVVLSALVKNANNPDYVGRARALDGIEKFVPRHPDLAIPVLIDCLKAQPGKDEPSSSIRYRCAVFLVSQGQAVEPFKKQIEALLSNKDPETALLASSILNTLN